MRNRLSSAFLKSAPTGKHCDGDGLWFIKRKSGGAQWMLRYTINGKRKEMGLGGYPTISLADARKTAHIYYTQSKQGIDPKQERHNQKIISRKIDVSLSSITLATFEAKKAELKDDGKAGRWLSPLNLHVLPKLGDVSVEKIDQLSLYEVIAPLWHTKYETARKALNRMNAIVTYAAALDLNVDIALVLKTKALLGETRHEPKHMPAMPWREVPDFYATLCQQSTQTELALRLLILTGLRSKAIRFLRTEYIEHNILTVPARLMKGRKRLVRDFKVPLSSEALSVIAQASRFEKNGFIFSGVRKGVISDMTMSQYMLRAGYDARPHGFRTSLREWIADTQDVPHEVAEITLGHKVDSEAVRAYRRNEYLEQRLTLLEKWAEYLRYPNES